MWFLAVLFAVFSPLGVAACNLSSLLGGPALGVYYASYQETASFPLASIAAPVNMVLLSFAQPNTGYSAGSYTLSGTGLNFVSTFAQVKANVATLKSRGFVVMLSAGGATYFWDKPAFNATARAWWGGPRRVATTVATQVSRGRRSLSDRSAFLAPLAPISGRARDRPWVQRHRH